MRAIVHEGKEGLNGLAIKDMDQPSLQKNQVLVKMKTFGMNRRDLAVTMRHNTNDPALILGSDGAGIIESVGSSVNNWSVGDEVVINPGMGWKDNSDAPPEGFEIVGLPDHGTFSEFMAVDANHVERKPSHLSWEEAGVLSLAALTAYRAVFTRGKLTKEDTIMLPGIGSGVLTFALKYAKAIGARVIVTSRSDEKLKKASELGADVTVQTQSDWKEELKDEQVDLLIESVGAATFNKSLDIIRKGGTIVTFGATTDDDVTINIRKFFYGQYNLLGSTMGSAEELCEMISFIEEHDIKPEIDHMFEMNDYKQAFEYLRDTKNFGKIGFSL
ncbi:alcohol dehydrogenase [Halalkalibacillus sediminis]|uniref:Alcohol dehydrogenase n=1 Tax=Halalkalibacillus sediminis TaxID=2018042 RepID=A0A2I0QVQ8_9BACI|nr:zinc-binding dehydrogenase [Halalkalibacillus sediminis]PKR78379.1 alcohol dehydrogenase [Halalkalibacillus sediminis]